ncbi:hypothetical protein M8J75_007313 [Diaphorina citri]|nr:hypothetical protein M8J75_007313 [Diaphorina citri]
MSEELLLADIDDLSDDDKSGKSQLGKSAAAWSEVKDPNLLSPSAAIQHPSADPDDETSFSSRPSSSHDSAKTVLTAVAQVHTNKGLDVSSEEEIGAGAEVLDHDEKERQTRTVHHGAPLFQTRAASFDHAPDLSTQPGQTSRPQSRQSVNQDGDAGGGGGRAGGVTSVTGVRGVNEIQKETESDLRKPSLGNTTAFDSRRPSVADTSEGSRSQTPHSDTRSYRERLKDRIQTVKEKASSSVFTTQSRSRLRQKLMKQHSTLSQMSDMLKKEEAQVVAALEKHNQIKSKWKTVTRASLEIAQSDEAFDFFTKVWDDEKETQPSGEPPKSSSETSSPKASEPQAAPAEITSDGEDKAKLGAADYLGLRTEDTEWSLTTKWMPAIDKVISGPNTWIYYPSTEPVPLQEKLPDNSELRHEENEGIFVPEKPPVSEKNYNKLQQRLLAEKNTKWFGEDGEVIRESDPLLGNSYRPPIVDSTPSHGLDLVFVPALKFDILTSKTAQTIAPKKTLAEEKYFLELQILELKFSHHALFSREHVLATLLSQLYAKYVHRTSTNISRRVAQRLAALRSAKYALVNLVRETEEQEGEERKKNVDAIQKYKLQIREARALKFREQKMDRELLAQVLITWRELKHLRETQKYSNTDLKLKITQVEDPSAREDYETEINETWNEMLEEALDTYEEQKKIYDAWLIKHQDDDEPSPPEDRLEPPSPVNQEALREAMMSQLAQSVRPPTEPLVHIELAHTGVTPESEITDQSELTRRAALRKVSIWLKILYNGVELCRSPHQPLSCDFRVRFNQLFTIRILNPPEELSVEIHSEGPGKCRPLASVFVPIPNSASTLENSPPEEHEFGCELIWHCTGSSGVGSGTLFYLTPESGQGNSGQGYCLYTSGTLRCMAGWMCNEGRVYSVPPEMLNQRNNAASRHQMELVSDMTKLKQWCHQSQLDPNDPNNAPFFALLKNAHIDEESTHSSQFRLNLLTQMLELCSVQDIETNPRLTLLTLRDRGEPEFRGMRSIPLREREIPNDVFKIYEKRLQSPSFPLEISSAGPQQNSLELVRSWGGHCLKNIRDRVLKQCKLAQQHRTHTDVISEDHVPDVGTLGLTFVKWLQPDRPLRPKRKERKKVPVQSLSGQEVKVLVSVVRAFEIPIRKDVDAISEDKISMVPVRPFVEVSFEGFSARTTTAEGANPTWNQDLIIPILPATSDFSPGALQNITSCLHVHLFDEIVVDLIEDEAQRENNIHQRLERNWLGSLTIPFSTLYFNSKIEGTFKLYSPPFLLGYDRSTSCEEASYLRHSTFLTLILMVQPPLNPPEPLTENLDCSEAPYVEKHLRQFQADYKLRFPHREMKSLVIDVTGKCVCVTRYFRPLAPPSFGDNVPPTESLVTRFVSMIPAVSGTVLFPGLFDIWLTNDQILKLLCGDCEDHAVLLMCYLLYLDITCWLLLGQGIPDGSVAFVLIRTNTDEFYIVHPIHGLKYSVHDSFSPLHKVYCLINQENIWVNIQEEEIVKRTRFDVRKSQDWLPVFNRNDNIEKQLRTSIAHWRKSRRTVWNRYCISVLRKILPLMEKQAWDQTQTNSLYHFPQVQHIISSYKMCGFPINLPFTNFAAILDAVKSTGVHKIESEDVEWALAVCIQPFPCHVLSVWIYVATLTRRR